MYVFKRTKGEFAPVSLDEIKDWNYIEDRCLDNKLSICITAGVAAVETFINGVVWPSIFALSLDYVAHEIPFQEYPVKSIAVKVDGEPLDSSLFSYDGRLIKVSESVTGQNMSITAEVGDEDIEGDIKAAILLVASELFRNPTDGVKTLPTASQTLLKPYRRANI